MAVLRTPPVPLALQERIWRKTAWEPHPMQRTVLSDPTRHKVVALGRRAGKSQTGGHRLIPEAFRSWYELDDLRALGQRREYWIVGPEYSDSEKEFRVLWNGLKQLGFAFDKPGSYYNPESGSMVVSLFDGAFITAAKSAKYPATLVGEGLSGVVMAEAAKLKPSVWVKFIRPTLADFEGWSLFLSTPEGRNWFYDLWDSGQNPDTEEWRSWRAPSWVNPYVYPDGADEDLLKRAVEAKRRHELSTFIDALKKSGEWGNGGPAGIDAEVWALFLDQSLEMFNQEIAAHFTEFVGQVFKDFDEEINVSDQDFDPTWMTFACADYGFTNPFVWLLVQIDPFRERVHIVDEYYETQKTTDEAGSDIANRGLAPRTVRRFFPDPAEPDRTKTLANRLQLKPYDRGSIPLRDRIEWIRRGLKYDPRFGGPKLTIHRRCRSTIREFNEYRYPELSKSALERGRNLTEEPEKKNNHSIEALGRFYSGMFGSPWKSKSGPRQSRMKVGTR